MRNTTKIVIGIIAAIVLIYGAFALDLPYANKVDDFETCVAAGNTVMESYPRQCRDKKGNMFVETLPVASTSDMIRVAAPLGGAQIESPLIAKGEARGTWFFEASFPIEIRAKDGTVLGSGPAQATGEWMTENFVPFTASVYFDPKGNTEGIVRFKNDNPSGDPARDLYVDVPVTFKAPSVTGAKACMPTGCGGQLCSDENIISTCVYRPEYACYKSAVCKRQASGKCGWTETPELALCLANPPGQPSVE
jgi:hypothetical protein